MPSILPLPRTLHSLQNILLTQILAQKAAWKLESSIVLMKPTLKSPTVLSFLFDFLRLLTSFSNQYLLQMDVWRQFCVCYWHFYAMERPCPFTKSRQWIQHYHCKWIILSAFFFVSWLPYPLHLDKFSIFPLISGYVQFFNGEQKGKSFLQEMGNGM